jgi:hypothetical protein
MTCVSFVQPTRPRHRLAEQHRRRQHHLSARIAFGIAFWICAHCVYAHAAETKIEGAGQTVVSDRIDTDKITVRLKTHTVDIGRPTDGVPKERSSNCTYSRYPCSLVDNVTISINDKPLFIPRSVFSDLADLNTASLKNSQRGIVLTFIAGDASEAYVVEITFNAKQVLQRKLFDAEFPANVWQETVYTFKPIPSNL